MAIFEKYQCNKTLIDDTEKLICKVENTQNINNHTEYIIKVQRGITKDGSWNVSHRYKDFASLHSSLQPANINIPLPPKKLVGNMQPSFIAGRKVALENYLTEVLRHQILSLCLQVRSFLDPKNYPLDISEQALQTVSIALRGIAKFELSKPLPQIGWRVRKHYYMVTETGSKSNYILSWINYGPDRYLSDKSLQTAFKCLQSVIHQNIDPVISMYNLETGVYVVRRIHDKGTLRDIIYGTDYNKTYISKYFNPKLKKPLTTGQCAHYGLQILQALKFLHDKGLFHGHIHPGNIVIENQIVLLLDTENSLLGVPSLYRGYILELRKTCTMENVDVYCFGRTMYEMAFGVEMDKAYCDSYPDGISEELVSILQLTVSSSACKHGVPSIEELLTHPFFNQPLLFNNSKSEWRPQLKIPSGLKEELVKGATVVLDRIRRDQKELRDAKRESRIQEILNSKEQLREHKKRAKKRDSTWKSTSSLADTVRSHSDSTESFLIGSTRNGYSANHSMISTQSINGTNGHHTVKNVTNGHQSLNRTANGHHSVNHSASTSTTASPPANDGRSSLLSAICSFDKNRLTRVNSQ